MLEKIKKIIDLNITKIIIGATLAIISLVFMIFLYEYTFGVIGLITSSLFIYAGVKK